MTKKKQRARLARALRAQGISGGRSFAVAKAVVKAGSPCEVPASVLASLGLGSLPGGFCPVRFKHTNTQVFCLTSGGCVVTAWQAFHASA